MTGKARGKDDSKKFHLPLFAPFTGDPFPTLGEPDEGRPRSLFSFSFSVFSIFLGVVSTTGSFCGSSFSGRGGDGCDAFWELSPVSLACDDIDGFTSIVAPRSSASVAEIESLQLII